MSASPGAADLQRPVCGVLRGARGHVRASAVCACDRVVGAGSPPGGGVGLGGRGSTCPPGGRAGASPRTEAPELWHLLQLWRLPGNWGGGTCHEHMAPGSQNKCPCRQRCLPCARDRTLGNMPRPGQSCGSRAPCRGTQPLPTSQGSCGGISVGRELWALTAAGLSGSPL